MRTELLTPLFTVTPCDTVVGLVQSHLPATAKIKPVMAVMQPVNMQPVSMQPVSVQSVAMQTFMRPAPVHIKSGQTVTTSLRCDPGSKRTGVSCFVQATFPMLAANNVPIRHDGTRDWSLGLCSCFSRCTLWA
jgi:hypothetical protein